VAFSISILGAAPSDVGAGISIIPYRQQFVKRKVVQKSKSLDARICATLPVDFWCGLWYTIIVKGREPPTEGKRIGLDELLDASSVRMGRKCLYNLPLSVANFFERNFKKPLDKSPKL
jgi:hypothetical protein